MRGHTTSLADRCRRIYIYKEIFENSSYQIIDGDYWWTGQKIRPANITFLYNYSDATNQGYYRLDNIESGYKIPKPSNPERTGYEFIGWFTEPSCSDAWDFNNTKEISSDDEFRLYAGWQVK